uniref:Amino acid transporter transmembrane domain-containing protein n=1 Tax=Proboscia inermis TaxID=420281 RepID=A0A7S0C7M1_9STRA|mmetsp:Transcript_3222/g.3237  ORF Transcript_3222/g.3237 Transcript_3222/m.3237 type:complete len:382 (+) Transcript_3222:461-1606(+)|eukprot:CAMPEP_0171292878 /NCGR_PEP_ID=MMETSP0816-20121228/897_1 /TAXON_ID=420281 /ORGANISM="Proboscia inermis, Strain CCAP1064/1" /LENGTH=381 /DNA_ID=CAMNT_0011763083 /DNA_START=410 /DNA_END=1555 /DNA_ORIENTATION=-
MKSLHRSKTVTNTASYVELAKSVLGEGMGRLVFGLTLGASLGVCSSYLVFIGQTLASLSCDADSSNILRVYFPDVSVVTWEVWSAAILIPLCLLRSYKIFAFTSALGVVAVVGGLGVTVASGIFVDPGGGLITALQHVGEQRMFPSNLADAFGGSFGTVAFLFCINFLTFPIMNSMERPVEYPRAISNAVTLTALVNIVFAILCVGFYGENTQDLVLANLGNGPTLSILKLLLCVDLFFTFPIVFSSGRQIMELAIIRPPIISTLELSDGSVPPAVSVARVGIAGGGVCVCLGLAQIGGFGTVANLVGGVAQGTLAFVLPPLIAVTLSRRDEGLKNQNLEQDITLGGVLRSDEFRQAGLGLFGICVVLSTSYFTAASMFAT